jgi:hypothetical protein
MRSQDWTKVLPFETPCKSINALNTNIGRKIFIKKSKVASYRRGSGFARSCPEGAKGWTK